MTGATSVRVAHEETTATERCHNKDEHWFHRDHLPRLSAVEVGLALVRLVFSGAVAALWNDVTVAAARCSFLSQSVDRAFEVCRRYPEDSVGSVVSILFSDASRRSSPRVDGQCVTSTEHRSTSVYIPGDYVGGYRHSDSATG